MTLTKHLRFYKDSKDNCWYLYLKYFPKFLRPLLQMVAGADRLLDLLWLESKDLVTENEINRYYANRWEEIYWLTCDVDTNTKLNRNVNNFRFSLKLNKYLNREMKMDHTRDGRIYMLDTIDLFGNTEFLRNEERKLFGTLGLGNNIWLCFVTWFVFGFRYPKKINVGNIKTYKFNYEELKNK